MIKQETCLLCAHELRSHDVRGKCSAPVQERTPIQLVKSCACDLAAETTVATHGSYVFEVPE